MASKKIDLDFVLSDSSINVYGFRLATTGYLMDEFLKNPIGYYCHEKEDGVLVRWEDVRIEGDRVLGKPVVNLEHPRGERTVTEIEEGFLNAASLGNIVVLEYHTEAQGTEDKDVVVVDKWYNKECSLVDSPGNREAFRTELADGDGATVTLQDLMDRRNGGNNNKAIDNNDVQMREPGFKKVELTLTPEVLELLDLADAGDEAAIVLRLRELRDAGNQMRQELAEVQQKVRAAEVKEILTQGLNDGRLTQAAKTELELHFAGNPEALRKLVDTFPAYQSIVDRLQKVPDEIKDLSDMSYDELDKADKLVLLLEKAPGLYKEKYQRKFGKAPANV